MKSIKKILLLSGIAIGSFAGYKIYKILRSVIDMEKTLPQYLENVFGEKPQIHITITFMQSHMKLYFSKKVIEKYDSIESTVQEYLTDFYPSINCSKLSISIIENQETPEADVTKESTEDSENTLGNNTEGILEENKK